MDQHEPCPLLSLLGTLWPRTLVPPLLWFVVGSPAAVSHHYGLTTSDETPVPDHPAYLGNLSGEAGTWEIPKVT